MSSGVVLHQTLHRYVGCRLHDRLHLYLIYKDDLEIAEFSFEDKHQMIQQATGRSFLWGSALSVEVSKLVRLTGGKMTEPGSGEEGTGQHRQAMISAIMMGTFLTMSRSY